MNFCINLLALSSLYHARLVDVGVGKISVRLSCWFKIGKCLRTVVVWDVTACNTMQGHAIAFFMSDPEYVGHLHTQILISSFAVTVIILRKGSPWNLISYQVVIDGCYSALTELAYPKSRLELLHKITKKNINLCRYPWEKKEYFLALKQCMNISANDVDFFSFH